MSYSPSGSQKYSDTNEEGAAACLQVLCCDPPEPSKPQNLSPIPWLWQTGPIRSSVVSPMVPYHTDRLVSNQSVTLPSGIPEGRTSCVL